MPAAISTLERRKRSPPRRSHLSLAIGGARPRSRRRRRPIPQVTRDFVVAVVIGTLWLALIVAVQSL